MLNISFSWPFFGLKVARPALTDFKKKLFFLKSYLGAQKEFQKKSSMWQYLLLEIYRFPHFFFLESQNFHVYQVDKNVVSKNPRDIFGISLVLVAKT